MSIIDELIYDRTSEDLEVARGYIKRNEPLPNDNLKYAWDNRALNRTEEAMEYVNDIFKELGYFRNMEFKTDWFADEITPEQSERYIANLKTLRGYLTMPSTTPNVPNTINGMSIERANEIEKIIHDIDIVLEALQNNYIYCGVANLGQNRVWQQRFRRKPYTRLEYIESTGTQYVDSDFIPTLRTRIKMEFSFDSIKSQDGIFGAQNINETCVCLFVRSNMKFGVRCVRSEYSSENLIPDLPLVTGQKYNIDFNIKNKYYSVNTYTRNFSNSQFPTENCARNLIIFAYQNRTTGNIQSMSKIKLYSFKIYDDDVLVRDFIPCVTISGKPCLIDKVENKFYYNQGTGDFIAGD